DPCPVRCAGSAGSCVVIRRRQRGLAGAWHVLAGPPGACPAVLAVQYVGGGVGQRGPRAAWMISVTTISVMRFVSCSLVPLGWRSSARTWRATTSGEGSGVFSAGRCRWSRRGWRWRRSGFRVRPGRGTGRAAGQIPGRTTRPRRRLPGRGRTRQPAGPRRRGRRNGRRRRSGRSSSSSLLFAGSGPAGADVVADGPGQRAAGDLPPAGFKGAGAELGGQARQMVPAGAGLRVGELPEHGDAPDRPVQGLAGLSPLFGEQAKLPITDGHAGPVPEVLFDGQGFAVPALGVVQPPTVLGDHTELVVAGRHGGPVPEVLSDGQGFAVPVPGVVQPAPHGGDDAEVVVAGRHAGLVLEVFFDGQGFAVPVLGVVQPPPHVGDGAELVV